MSGSEGEARPDGDAAKPRPSYPEIAYPYRRRRDRRLGPLRWTAILVVTLSMATFVGYYVHGALSPSTSSAGGTNSTVSFGALPPALHLGNAVVSNTTCGSGQHFEIETIAWQGASQPISTDQVYLVLEELIDGDVDGSSSGPAPMVSASSDCAGAAPHFAPSWYVVLQDPAGANIAYFTYGQDWIFLNSTESSLVIQNGSALVVLSDPNLAGLSFGMCVFGDLSTTPYDICVQL